jgi:hypothetical protein
MLPGRGEDALQRAAAALPTVARGGGGFAVVAAKPEPARVTREKEPELATATG